MPSEKEEYDDAEYSGILKCYGDRDNNDVEDLIGNFDTFSTGVLCN
jgi:hypothetical protein